MLICNMLLRCHVITVPLRWVDLVPLTASHIPFSSACLVYRFWSWPLDVIVMVLLPRFLTCPPVTTSPGVDMHCGQACPVGHINSSPHSTREVFGCMKCAFGCRGAIAPFPSISINGWSHVHYRPRLGIATPTFTTLASFADSSKRIFWP